MKNFILLAFIFCSFVASTFLAQTPSDDVRQIDALVKVIGSKTRRSKATKLIFADVSAYDSDTPRKWQRFPSESALERHRRKTEAYSIAYVWHDAGKTSSTNFTLFSPSGDWVKYVYSYFRPDGTLARVETDYRTFNGNFKVIRRRYFDSSGKEIKNSVRVLDLQSGKPKKAPDGVMGDDPNECDCYMTIADLPFQALLNTK